jgi:alkaline phosphatase D
MRNQATRRAFLAGAAGVAAAAAAPRLARASSSVTFTATDAPFPAGVASGDPLADRVILWTYAPTAGTAQWEVARDAEFASIVRTGTVAFSAASDFTAHVDVDGLEPDSYYWYRFRAAGGTSDVGRTRTSPAPGAAVDRLRVGVVTCAEWEFGYFGGYRVLAERDDVDVVFALGDYIYEFGNDYGSIPSPKPGGRAHVPPHETVTLDDYRARYRQYHQDAGLRALRARHPLIAMYDDHELANDWWKDGSQNHTPATEGDFHARRDAAMKAFHEWLPVRVNASDETIAYRRFQFGDLVDVFMLDERRYRDKPATSGVVGYFSFDPSVNDPNRTLLGETQRDWLLDGLAHSTSAWKVLGNPVAIVPIDVGPALAGAIDDVLVASGAALPPIPPPLYVDDWDGYNAERQRVVDHIAAHKVKDVVVLTGDYHESFASQIPFNRSTYDLDANSAAVEFVAPAITSPTLTETLQMGSLPHAATINTVFEANLAASNPWVKYHEGFSNGFGVAEFRRDGMQFDFWFVDDRTSPATAAHAGPSWSVRRGAAVLAQAAGPVGPRPDRVAPRPAPQPSGGVIPRTGIDQRAAFSLGAAAIAAAGLARLAKREAQPPR